MTLLLPQLVALILAALAEKINTDQQKKLELSPQC